MNRKNTSKGHTGILLLILIFLLIIWSLQKNSPIYYENLLSSVSTSYSIDIPLNTLSKPNSNIRKALEKGGNISFMYNYSPSSKSWDSMYSYSLYRYSSSGDCTFYCTRMTPERGNEDLCTCYYSERIWDELLDLILNNENLVECTSVYDANGKVLDIWLFRALDAPRSQLKATQPQFRAFYQSAYQSI